MDFETIQQIGFPQIDYIYHKGIILIRQDVEGIRNVIMLSESTIDKLKEKFTSINEVQNA